MHNATLEPQDYRQLLFGTSRNSLLYQFSRLQEIFEDYSDRILRKPYIDLSTEQSRVLMTLSVHERLPLAALQAQTGLESDDLQEAIGAMNARKLIILSQIGDDGSDPVVHIAAAGILALDRMRRLLQKADEVMFTELREARKTGLQESIRSVADQLQMHAN